MFELFNIIDRMDVLIKKIFKQPLFGIVRSTNLLMVRIGNHDVTLEILAFWELVRYIQQLIFLYEIRFKSSFIYGI